MEGGIRTSRGRVRECVRGRYKDESRESERVREREV